jgi:hypothetical protein
MIEFGGIVPLALEALVDRIEPATFTVSGRVRLLPSSSRKLTVVRAADVETLDR